MKKTAGTLGLVVMLSACSGGGGANSTAFQSPLLPNSGATLDGVTSKVTPASAAGAAQPITITEHTLGSTPSVGGMAIANDGSVWTQSNGTNSISRFVRWNNGLVTSYEIHAPSGQNQFTSSAILAASGSRMFGVALQNAPVGTGWFQEPFEISTSGGAITPITAAGINSGTGTFGYIIGLTAATNATVWEAQNFNQYNAGVSGLGVIAEISPGHTSFQLPYENNDPFAYDVPTALTQGPDSNLWVPVQNLQNAASPSLNYNAILVYTMSGKLLHMFKVENTVNSIVTGPDSAAWFTLQNGHIGRITTAGSIHYYASRTTTALGGITVGSDGALWFLEPNVNRLGRITTSGLATDYAIPTANSKPLGIAGPASGCQPYTLWFAESGSGKIAMVTYR